MTEAHLMSTCCAYQIFDELQPSSAAFRVAGRTVASALGTVREDQADWQGSVQPLLMSAKVPHDPAVATEQNGFGPDQGGTHAAEVVKDSREEPGNPPGPQTAARQQGAAGSTALDAVDSGAQDLAEYTSRWPADGSDMTLDRAAALERELDSLLGKRNPAALAQLADVAFKTAAAELEHGSLRQARRCFQVALKACPPARTKAMAKIETLLRHVQQQLETGVAHANGRTLGTWPQCVCADPHSRKLAGCSDS